jgi:hypothetical protein
VKLASARAVCRVAMLARKHALTLIDDTHEETLADAMGRLVDRLWRRLGSELA